jgi:hypothetical protein
MLFIELAALSAAFCAVPLVGAIGRWLPVAPHRPVSALPPVVPLIRLTRVSYKTTTILEVPHAVLYERGVSGLIDRVPRRLKAALGVVLVQDVDRGVGVRDAI